MHPASFKDFVEAVVGNDVKQLEKARSVCFDNLQRNSDDAVSLRFMGIIEKQLGHDDLALEWFEKATAAWPKLTDALKTDFAEAYYKLGNTYVEYCDKANAAEAYRNAISINPNYPEALHNLGLVLLKQGELEEAAKCYTRALAIKPDFPSALNNYATVLYHQGAFEDSVKLLEKALSLNPKYPEALNNFGIALRAIGRLEKSISILEQAVSMEKDNPNFHKNWAISLLAAGQFKRGWREYEWRWQTSYFTKFFQKMTKPRWKGQVIKDNTLLILAEQGFGDTLQFCRYVPRVAALGLRVVLQVPFVLSKLMKSLNGVEQVVQTGHPLPEYDFYCQMMSLPVAFDTRLATIPAAIPYLSVDDRSINYWRNQMRNSSSKLLKVGLVWAGNPRTNITSLAATDRRRSIDPRLLAPLQDIAGIQFYSLQKGGAPAPENFNLINLIDKCHDFADTAALIANLDLIIGVDTAVAHLAGAMGKPIWVLNRFDSCWRWLQTREDSPWYPTLRLFRQPYPGDWKSVISRVADELKQRVSLSCGLGSAQKEWTSRSG